MCAVIMMSIAVFIPALSFALGAYMLATLPAVPDTNGRPDAFFGIAFVLVGVVALILPLGALAEISKRRR